MSKCANCGRSTKRSIYSDLRVYGFQRILVSGLAADICPVCGPVPTKKQLQQNEDMTNQAAAITPCRYRQIGAL